MEEAERLRKKEEERKAKEEAQRLAKVEEERKVLNPPPPRPADFFCRVLMKVCALAWFCPLTAKEEADRLQKEEEVHKAKEKPEQLQTLEEERIEAERVEFLYSDDFLTACFQHLDKNGDGSLSLVEFLRMPVFGKRNDIFYQFDTDKVDWKCILSIGF